VKEPFDSPVGYRGGRRRRMEEKEVGTRRRKKQEEGARRREVTPSVSRESKVAAGRRCSVAVKEPFDSPVGCRVPRPLFLRRRFLRVPKP
jgi:hypothetical protein